MNLEVYQYRESESRFDYEFESVGPRGVIKKVVRLSLIGDNIYNLGFGDLDDETGEISDLKVSNNADMERVLATVAHIVWRFTGAHSGSSVFVKGSTLTRTRLYQRQITMHWSIVTPLFEIYGWNDGWELFRKNVNYEAFLARHRDDAVVINKALK